MRENSLKFIKVHCKSLQFIQVHHLAKKLVSFLQSFNLKTSTKILGALGLTAIALKANSLFKKASRLADNIYVSAAPESFKLINASTVSVLFSVSLKNVSGFNLKISNVISKLYLVSESGVRTEAGMSDKTPSLSFKDNQTIVFPVSFQFSYITLIGKILSGSVKQIEIVTNYEFAGQPMSYSSQIDFASFISKAKSFITGRKQVSGVGHL